MTTMHENKRKITFFSFIALLLLAGVCGSVAAADDGYRQTARISGHIFEGYRVLQLKYPPEKVNLTVYRGDYIKFAFDESVGEAVLTIPALSVHEPLPKDISNAPYFKMKHTGRYNFALGRVSGTITVVEYRELHYRSVDSNQAAAFIKRANPLILDVRTPAEYRKGHLENAVLIPVQQLQKRIGELAAYKDTDIFIYCATGNRSTVASKILIDNGFKRITNLRHGIKEWLGQKKPIAR